MSRYIDAEALPYEALRMDEDGDWYMMLDDIKNAPTADVAPVVHGRWVVDERCGDYFCTECGRRTVDRHDEIKEFEGAPVIALTLPHYCGYCGAKME